MSHFNLHHMHPSSCGGQTDEFNLFPYRTNRHNDWHKIFLNMTIRDIWQRLDEIYCAVFFNNLNDDDMMNRYWLSECKLPSRKDLENQLQKRYEVAELQGAWISAFGSDDLSRARVFMKYMMLFIVFGSDTAGLKNLFNNLPGFFKKFPAEEGERRWAFENCFGKNATWHKIRCVIVKIVKKSS